MKAAHIWRQYTTFKAKTQGNRVLVTQGCSLSRFFTLCQALLGKIKTYTNKHKGQNDKWVKS